MSRSWENLTPDDIEAALRNSGFDFNSKIIDVKYIGDDDYGHGIYEVTWDPVQDIEPVTFCNTIYLTDLNGKLYGDI